MKNYDSYISRGWIGKLPSHWEIRRLRFLFSENKKKNTKITVRNQLQFKYGTIVPKQNQSIDTDVLDTISKYTIVDKGDIMINGLNLNYDFISQRVALVKESGVITSAYLSLKPTDGVNYQYYNYFFKALDNKKWFHGLGSGIRLTLSYEDLKNIFLPYPSDKEQNAIVSYLDNELLKIDQVIAQQQKMIDLLNERKQIIIQKAVTKGLDPNVEMKDSGDEVIGRIPNQWEIARFKNVAYVKANLVHPNLYLNFPQISPDNIEKNTGKLFGVKTVEECGIISDNHLFHKGQIIYSKIRPTLNKVTLAPYEGLCSADMYPIETTMNNKYLLYYMLSNSFVSQVSFYVMDRVKMPKINRDELGQILVTIPPSAEQKKIVDFIESKLAVISNAVAKCFNITALLQERKQIIINDVVTGKIKVSE